MVLYVDVIYRVVIRLFGNDEVVREYILILLFQYFVILIIYCYSYITPLHLWNNGTNIKYGVGVFRLHSVPRFTGNSVSVYLSLCEIFWPSSTILHCQICYSSWYIFKRSSNYSLNFPESFENNVKFLSKSIEYFLSLLKSQTRGQKS